MAYFPHAFQKMLIGTSFVTGDGTKTTLDLTAGQIGLMDPITNKLATLGTLSYPEVPMIVLAQGSFYANDKLGPFHGGYKETVKSKGINPKYVSAFYVTEPAEPVNQVVTVSASACELTCNTTYRMRLDVKGSPALRFITHNAYLTVDGSTGCCVEGLDYTDPNVILTEWAKRINDSVIINPFVQAKVYTAHVEDSLVDAGITDGDAKLIVANADKTKFAVGAKVTSASSDGVVTSSVPAYSFVVSVSADDAAGVGFAHVTLSKEATADVANGYVLVYSEISYDTYTASVVADDIAKTTSHMDLVGAYVDTKFGNCSFSPKDHFEIEPVRIYPSIVDQNGDPCETTCFAVAESVEGYQGKGYGEQIIRELMLSNSYRQDYWSQDPRMREILGDTTFDQVDRNSKYYVYHILHSVPRKSNPSGTLDNDQYLIKIVVDSRSTAFENAIDAYLTAANNHVQLSVQL